MPRNSFSDAELRALRAMPAGARAAGDEPPRRREAFLLPVDVRSRERPNGVALTGLLEAVKREAPSVSGLAVRGRTVTVTHVRAPTRRERKRLEDLLHDRARLEELRPSPPASEAVELEHVLRDESLAQDEWLRTFRRYAVEHLIGRSR